MTHPQLICLKCPRRSRRVGRSIVCTVSGREITDHVQAHVCPTFRYQIRGAGDVLANVFARTGVDRLVKLIVAETAEARQWTWPDGVKAKPCGCKARQGAMNRAVPLN